jgi:hypothetical protein
MTQDAVEVLQQNALHEYNQRRYQRQQHTLGEIVPVEGGFIRTAPKYNPMHSSNMSSMPQYINQRQMAMQRSMGMYP